jgi:hypothetical protein
MVELMTPSGVRLGIVVEHDATPEVVEFASQHLYRHGLEPARRLARIQPRLGEPKLRSADLADFVERYGHEYTTLMFDGASTFASDSSVAAAARVAGCEIVVVEGAVHG